MPVTDTDRGARALLRELKRLGAKRLAVKVGIFGPAAGAQHGDGPATVGQIANAHEHGLGVPRRSWCADTVAEALPDIRAGLRAAAADVVARKRSPDQALARLGLYMAGRMRARIAAGIPPALSAAYLPRKLARYPGATTPLIASSQMIGSIGSVVEGSTSATRARAAAGRKALKRLRARNRRIKRARAGRRALRFRRRRR